MTSKTFPLKYIDNDALSGDDNALYYPTGPRRDSATSAGNSGSCSRSKDCPTRGPSLRICSLFLLRRWISILVITSWCSTSVSSHHHSGTNTQQHPPVLPRKAPPWPWPRSPYQIIRSQGVAVHITTSPSDAPQVPATCPTKKFSRTICYFPRKPKRPVSLEEFSQDTPSPATHVTKEGEKEVTSQDFKEVISNDPSGHYTRKSVRMPILLQNTSFLLNTSLFFDPFLTMTTRPSRKTPSSLLSATQASLARGSRTRSSSRLAKAKPGAADYEALPKPNDPLDDAILDAINGADPAPVAKPAAKADIGKGNADLLPRVNSVDASSTLFANSCLLYTSPSPRD